MHPCRRCDVLEAMPPNNHKNGGLSWVLRSTRWSDRDSRRRCPQMKATKAQLVNEFAVKVMTKIQAACGRGDCRNRQAFSRGGAEADRIVRSQVRRASSSKLLSRTGSSQAYRGWPPLYKLANDRQLLPKTPCWRAVRHYGGIPARQGPCRSLPKNPFAFLSLPDVLTRRA